MPDENELALLDEVDEEDESTDEVEDSEEESTEEQPDEKLTLLERRLSAVEGQNSKIVRDFSAAVGRVQSLMDRMESGRTTDTERLQTQINSAVGTVEQQLDALLASDMVDPEVRSRALAARERMRSETELAKLRSEVESMRNPPAATPPTIPGEDMHVAAVEQNVHTMIESAGMTLNDFNWDDARDVYARFGDRGIYAYFTNKIAERKSETVAAERRQARKTNAGKGAPAANSAGAGDIASRLERSIDSGNLDEGVALLRELGVNPF